MGKMKPDSRVHMTGRHILTLKIDLTMMTRELKSLSYLCAGADKSRARAHLYLSAELNSIIERNLKYSVVVLQKLGYVSITVNEVITVNEEK